MTEHLPPEKGAMLFSAVVLAIAAVGGLLSHQDALKARKQREEKERTP